MQQTVKIYFSSTLWPVNDIFIHTMFWQGQKEDVKKEKKPALSKRHGNGVLGNATAEKRFWRERQEARQQTHTPREKQTQRTTETCKSSAALDFCGRQTEHPYLVVCW